MYRTKNSQQIIDTAQELIKNLDSSRQEIKSFNTTEVLRKQNLKLTSLSQA